MKQPFRVLLVNKAYPPHIGGIEYLVERYAQYLKQQPETEVQVLVCQAKGKGSVEVIDGVTVKRSGSMGTYFSCPLSVSFLWEFRQLSKWADVIVLHMPFPLGDLGCLLSGYRGRVVLAWHSDIVKQKKLLVLYRPLLRWLLHRADAILTATAGHIDSSPFLPSVREKCHVIPYGIPVEQYLSAPPAPILTTALHDKTAVKLLFVGRLVYYKGVQYLLEAMESVQGAELFLVGTGTLAEALRQQAQKPELQNKVHFLGSLPDGELKAAFQDCDLLVLPSVENSEAFGLVQLEAMVYGKPVINTALPTGVPYVSLDGETGCTVPPKDAGRLAAAIQHLIAEPELRKQYGMAAQRRTAEIFSESVVMQQIGDVLRNSLTGKQKGEEKIGKKRH